MVRPTKPPHVPTDIWQTCNDQQRQWVIADHERQQQAERIRRRVAAGRARADDTKKGNQHEQ